VEENVMARPAWTALALALAATMSGCGTSEDTVADATVSPEAAVTPDAAAPGATDAVAWADGVCTAADDLESSLDSLGSSLEVDLGSAPQVRAQIAEQVQGQVDVVRDDVRALASAVAAVPEESDPDVVAAAEDLEADRQALEGSVGALRDAAEQLTDATDAASTVEGVGAVVAQFTVVRLDAATFADSLESAADQGATSVRAAFVDAAGCNGRF
jgi:hypothetical protein